MGELGSQQPAAMRGPAGGLPFGGELRRRRPGATSPSGLWIGRLGFWSCCCWLLALAMVIVLVFLVVAACPCWLWSLFFLLLLAVVVAVVVVVVVVVVAVAVAVAVAAVSGGGGWGAVVLSVPLICEVDKHVPNRFYFGNVFQFNES